MSCTFCGVAESLAVFFGLIVQLMMLFLAFVVTAVEFAFTYVFQRIEKLQKK